MMKKGFVKFNRKIIDWGWYTDVNTFKLFFHLILCANYTDGTFLGVKVLRGQIATSISRLAKETGLTVNEARTAKKHLESTGEITSESHGKFSVISIPNYDLYQSELRETLEKTHKQKHENSVKLCEKLTSESTSKSHGENAVISTLDSGLHQSEAQTAMQTHHKRLTNSNANTSQAFNNNIRNNKNNKKYKKERMNGDSFDRSSEKQKLRFLHGELGGGVVLLSEEQEEELLDMLSVEEFDKYVSIIRDCELSGKHFKKPHYQAIVEMVNEDRKTDMGQ